MARFAVASPLGLVTRWVRVIRKAHPRAATIRASMVPRRIPGLRAQPRATSGFMTARTANRTRPPRKPTGSSTPRIFAQRCRAPVSPSPGSSALATVRVALRLKDLSNGSLEPAACLGVESSLVLRGSALLAPSREPSDLLFDESLSFFEEPPPLLAEESASLRGVVFSEFFDPRLEAL